PGGGCSRGLGGRPEMGTLARRRAVSPSLRRNADGSRTLDEAAAARRQWDARVSARGGQFGLAPSEQERDEAGFFLGVVRRLESCDCDNSGEDNLFSALPFRLPDLPIEGWTIAILTRSSSTFLKGEPAWTIKVGPSSSPAASAGSAPRLWTRC